MFILGFIMLALVFGYLQGGKLASLSQVRLRYGLLVVAAFILQATVYVWDTSYLSVAAIGIIANGASYALIIVFMLANRGIAGAPVIATGLLLNFFAILSNGGYMPGSIAVAGTGLVNLGYPADPPLLWFLGDVLSMPQALSFGGAFSIGDVCVGIGVFAGLRELMEPASAEIRILRPRYQPKHLASASKRLLLVRRAS
ncbi:MAG: DUF5317 domain-containing protein [Actinobacteria bacterium]|nr:DUF5317 domain-containing protein [Actinomycetota bacterium]